MFVSGFSFIRNAEKLDYPVREAIRSVLPLVDEMVVAVGKSEDQTREWIHSLGPKIVIVDSEWDDQMREGGRVLAQETNKALQAVNPKADWCVYVQADECYHQEDYAEIRQKMERYKDMAEVEGLLFNYYHFYGSYDYLGDSRKWYRREVRIVKPHPGLKSYKDAQGFRKEGKKLKVKALDASIYHYGWVRHPKFQMAKQLEAHKLWHSDQQIQKKFNADKDFDYSQIDSIVPFKGSHPEAMQERIERMNWKFERDPSIKKFSLKQSLLYSWEKMTGQRIGEYKNYQLIKH